MSNIVFLNGKNEVVTDSLMVAEVFGKKHHHVLDSVKEIISKSKNGKTNFRLSYYNAGTRQYPKYELNRDGFVMLIMGFTGDKAFEFKEMYIDEFNRMEEKLKQMLTDSYLIDDPIARAEKWIKEQKRVSSILSQPIISAMKTEARILGNARKGNLNFEVCEYINVLTKSTI